jgi:predicted transcriptional regulator
VKKKPTRGGARAGAGRPASGRKQVTLRLSDATVDRLDRIVPERIGQARVIDAAVGRLTDRQLKEMAE